MDDEENYFDIVLSDEYQPTTVEVLDELLPDEGEDNS